MPKNTKICRVCGATYDACNSIRTGSGVFNWREVACSPKCGMMYLEKVTASRDASEKPDMQKVVKKVSRKKDVIKHEISHVEKHTVDHSDVDVDVLVDTVVEAEEADGVVDTENNVG